MDSNTAFDTLLSATREVWATHPDLAAFKHFPDDVTRQPLAPYPLPCGDVFLADTGLVAPAYPALQEAVFAAAPHAQWRETYRGTDIGDDFMTRFGCYCIIGEGGPFTSQQMRLYMVYMPPGLDYPWHHHPAEEIYLVVSGSAVFRREGHADKTLTAGETSFHESNQPHAMETIADPILCLVAWRNRFETPPVLT